MNDEAYTSTCPCGANLIGSAGDVVSTAPSAATVTCFNGHEWTVQERRVAPTGAMTWKLGLRLDEYSRQPD
jgi:hypothetical protein